MFGDFNTIILKKGETRLSDKKYKDFEKGDTIWGLNADPEELKRWNIKDKEQAEAELAKYRCSYRRSTELWFVEEYALEYCECDEDGGFIQGSDYGLAEEA